MAAFSDLVKASGDNDVLTIFVIRPIRIWRHSFTSHIGILSTAHKALDDHFQQCLIPIAISSSSVSSIKMQDYFTNGVLCDMKLEGSPL